ncbi:hypothetical protein [Thermosporothrix hazakensis]|uniref:hypothetical protein n=1 Tax=Thermosporothrix hazakensis TaxID=644383 RepID=UPI001B869E77|nr:hypothetical protein [Thermosporothrix hazakensis]
MNHRPKAPPMLPAFLERAGVRIRQAFQLLSDMPDFANRYFLIGGKLLLRIYTLWSSLASV